MLVKRERKREIQQLREAARAPRRGAGLLLDPSGRCLDEAGRCVPGRISCDHEAGCRLPGDRVEHDRGHDSIAEVGREPVCPEAAELAPVGGDEEERVRGTDDARSGGHIPRNRGRVRAGELDQRGDPGGVVVGARPGAGVVEMCKDGERLRRAARNRHDQILESYTAAPRDRGRKRLAADLEPQVGDLLGEPLSRALGAG